MDKRISMTVKLVDAKENQCRWIIGHPKSQKCCGKEVVKGSYCHAHYRRCYKK